jgi:hypothetical protein
MRRLVLIAFLWAAPAWATVVPLHFTAPCTDAPPARPDTACGLTQGAPALTGLSHGILHVIRFNPGDTLTLRIELAGRECQDVAFDLDVLPGTMGYAWVTTFDYAGNESCPSPSTVFAVEAVSQYGTGLRGEYYDDSSLTELRFARFDSVIDFNWGTGSPDPSIDPDGFSVRWTGFLTPPKSGEYAFCVEKNDGARLWIGDIPVVDSWYYEAPPVACGSMSLVAGAVYPLRLQFFEAYSSARAILKWTPPGGTLAVVPAEALSH